MTHYALSVSLVILQTHIQRALMEYLLNIQLAATLRLFTIGLVGATVTHVTKRWWTQPVDIVGAAVLRLNGAQFFAAISRLVKADNSCDYTLSQCRMAITQPTWEACIASARR